MEQENNVTLRKHQTATKSRLMESLNRSFNTSLMSCDEVLGRSLDLSTNMSSTFVPKLKNEIKELKASV